MTQQRSETAGYQHILVATDFSSQADAAHKQGVWLAKQSGVRFALAHTLPDLRRAAHGTSYEARIDLLYGEGDLFQLKMQQKSDTKMRRMIVNLNTIDLDVKFETLLGEPFVELKHGVQGGAAWQHGGKGTRHVRL